MPDYQLYCFAQSGNAWHGHQATSPGMLFHPSPRRKRGVQHPALAPGAGMEADQVCSWPRSTL